MRKVVCFSLLPLIFVSASCFADNTPDPTSLNTYFNRLHSVSCDKTGTICTAVGFGAEGTIHDLLVYTTQDAGITWSNPILLTSPNEEQELGTYQKWSNVSCNDSGLMCMITSSAITQKKLKPVVYMTADGGATWSDPNVLPLPKKSQQTTTVLG